MIQAFMLKHPARFYDVNDYNSPLIPRDLVGYRDGTAYMFLKEGLLEACQGLNYRNSLKYIKDLKYLNHEDGRLDNKATIKSKEARPRLFIIETGFIEHDFVGAAGALGHCFDNQ